ncbi:MAG: pyridoxamine 5'-phosphate oxidase [Proteobacteria bacterium]|nr:MAG: pyridoxamine 5'-phosphate oxidase [Pseudomonadota bacterium]
MAQVSKKKIAEIIADLDLCMLTTESSRGALVSRPMSNNGQVEFDGDSYFFTYAKSRLVQDIKKNPQVNLSFASSRLLKKIYISVAGVAEISKDKAEMLEHWDKELNIWFKKGVQTPGITMIRVRAKRIKYWYGNKEGEYAAK